MPVVSSGVVLISGVVGAGAYGDDPVLGVVFGLLTAVELLGIPAHPARGEPGRAPARRGRSSTRRLAAALGSLLIGWALGELELAPSWPEHGWLVLLALSAQVAGWLLISVSLPRVPAALTSVVLTLQPVAAVVLAAVILDERPSPAQTAGVAVVVAGILLATVRRPGGEAARAASAST